MPEFPPDKRGPQGNDPDSQTSGRRLRASSRPRFRGDSAASESDSTPQSNSPQQNSRASQPQRSNQNSDRSTDPRSDYSFRSGSRSSGDPADNRLGDSTRGQGASSRSPHAPPPRPVAPRTRREARMLRAAAASGASAAGVAAAASSNTQDDPTTGSQHGSVRDAPRTFAQDESAASAGDPREFDHPGDVTDSAPTTRRDARERHAAESRSHGPGRARRHSSRLGETFPSLVGWTSLSTLLPGVGLLRTRFRPAGLIVFGLFVLTLLVGLVYLLVKGPVRAIATIIASPSLLNFLAIAAVLVAVIWILVMVVSHLGLRRGHRYRPWQNKLAGVLVVSLALIIGIPLGVGSVFARVQSDTVASLFGDSTGKAHSAEDLWADKPYINVFLMGRDNGNDREGTRPDTMLVASIDTKTGNAALISVPRNLAFPIFPEGSELEKAWPDGFRPSGDSSEDLINAVWQWGEQNPDQIGNAHGLEPGMWTTMQAVEGSLGLNLDYWASVDMAGFEDVVDAIGGVQIDVERPIPMGGGKSLSGVKNEVYGWVDPGPQTLKGKDALWYVRSREGSDNYDRMCRQQRMLKTTLEQVDPQEIAAAYPKLANSATRNIATSIPQNEIPAFIELALMMQKGDVTTVQINNDVTPTYNPDFDVLHKWILGEVKGASDGEETPQPTNDGSTSQESGDSADSTENGSEDTATEEPADSADGSTDEAGAEADATETTTPGEPNAEGKCYPKGYEPGDDFPGYPGPNGGTGEQG
ncbi:LCP family protein [Brevibacterium linens]|uniref:Transcriptional attenuator, LytR family n=1 Tax=Brevibacterium linens ATCC 9172 TaxID=1255617 RepID=A0A2H1IXP1_BRELN|nr:LCP family protein [Brevibacterium linens]SMX79861.1 transcriptional attenuator, LytR family [Brevibacterium linens ATCC 9172]